MKPRIRPPCLTCVFGELWPDNYRCGPQRARGYGTVPGEFLTGAKNCHWQRQGAPRYLGGLRPGEKPAGPELTIALSLARDWKDVARQRTKA